MTLNILVGYIYVNINPDNHAILSGTYFFFASKLEKKKSKSEIPKKFKK